MRTILLIRHEEPAFPEGRKTCLGRRDLPLSEKGRISALRLKKVLQPVSGTQVISSPLRRCIETSEAAGFSSGTGSCLSFFIDPGFAEIDTGEWDGRTFEEIRERWPERYAKRGEDPWNEPFPGGESFASAAVRSMNALRNQLERQPFGDLLIFTHRGVIRTLYADLGLCGEKEALELPCGYGSVHAFLTEEDGSITAGGDVPAAEGRKAFPDNGECSRLFDKYNTPEHVRAHCRAVAEEAVRIAKEQNRKGYGLNLEAVRSAAMLHDIARTEKKHAKAGAAILMKEGYPLIAPIVGDHMELPEGEERISEKSVVFYADKRIRGTGSVSLSERYLEGKDEKALPFAKRKYIQALRIQKLFDEEA